MLLGYWQREDGVHCKWHMLAEPFSGSNRNHYESTDTAFIGPLQAGYGTMIRSIKADVEQLKKTDCWMDTTAYSRASALFFTTLNIFAHLALSLSRTHTQTYKAKTLHKTCTNKIQKIQIYGACPCRPSSKVIKVSPKGEGVMREDNRLQRYTGSIEGRGERGRRDAHLGPVGQSRSAGVWGFDFPLDLHICVCVYSVILISRQLCT